MEITPPNNAQFLEGFLQGLMRRDRALATELLDALLDRPALAQWIPWLQVSIGLDSQGLARLHLAIQRGVTPASYFTILSGGRVCDPVPPGDFRDLILGIARMPDGESVALDILGMRLFSDDTDKRKSASEVLEASRALLQSYTFRDRQQLHQGEDGDLERLVKASLAGDDGAPIARTLTRGLLDGASDYRVSSSDYAALLTALLQTQPIAVLDELFSQDEKTRDVGIRLLRDARYVRKNPVQAVPDDILAAWCEGDPVIRYPIAAAVGVVFRRPGKDAPEEWTPLARRLLVAAPDPVPVLHALVRRLRPNGWSGSLATILEARLALLQTLDVTDLPRLSAAYQSTLEALRRSVDGERAREAEEGRGRQTSFE
jgi:hypothetical protein